MKRDKGLLVGSIFRQLNAYRYVIIPKNRIDIDVLWSMLPKSAKLYRVRSIAVADFLEGLYEVDFYYKVSISRVGPIYKAILGDNIRLIKIDIDNPLASLKKIDKRVEYYVYQDLREINSNFLVSLSRTLGTGTSLPMRFLSTQLATRIDDSDITLIMNFREAYEWMKKNPERLRGLAILPSYRLGVIIADPIEEEELKRDIVFKINESITSFEWDYIVSYGYEFLEPINQFYTWS